MKQAIITFVFFLALAITAGGQQDSIRKFATTISNMSSENNACGKAAKKYAADLAGIAIEEAVPTFKKFREKDSLTLKNNDVKNCKNFTDKVKEFDKWLAARRSQDKEFNNTLYHLFYLQQRLKGLVQVTAYSSDQANGDTLALASLTATGQDITDDKEWTSGKKFHRFFVPPGNEYVLTFKGEQYPAFTGSYFSYADTIVRLEMKKSTVVKPEPEPKPDPETTGYSWLFALLAALIGAGVGYLIGKQHRKSVTVQAPFQATLQPVVATPPVVKQTPALIPADGINYFESEVLVSAGPRKARGEETDLGEDVCGLVTISNKTFFWLMDGTSDGVVLRNPSNGYEYFSSRLLAQSIAIKARARAAEFETNSPQPLMANVMNDVRADWLLTMAHLPEQEKSFLMNNIKNGKKISCSTTVLLGSLSLSGELTTCRTGDSTLLLFGNDNGKLTLLPSSLNREKAVTGLGTYLVLSLDASGKLDLTIVETTYETIREQNVKAIIGFSDGLNSRFEKRLSDLFTKDSRIARKDLVLQPQDLGDDMSFYMVEIKTNN